MTGDHGHPAVRAQPAGRAGFADTHDLLLVSRHAGLRRRFPVRVRHVEHRLGAAVIPYHLSSFATGYLVAGASLGAAAGALHRRAADRPLRPEVPADHRRRGSTRSARCCPAFTINAGMLLASRTLIGLAIGADSAIATAYIAEFAPASRRGQLSIIQQWMITVGILVSYLVALVVLKANPGGAGNLDWRLILGLGAVPAIIGRRAAVPDAGVAALADAARALRRHRKAFGLLGMKVSGEDEARHGRRTRAPASRPSSTARRQWTAGVRRALIIVCVFFIFQQITGINVPFYYGPQVLSTYFARRQQRGRGRRGGRRGHRDPRRGQRDRDLLRVPLHRPARAARWPSGATSGWRCSCWSPRPPWPRLLTDLPQTVVVMVGCSFFIASFAIGVGGTGWLIQGEVFPTAGPGPGRCDRGGRRLAGQLRADRGVPGLEERDRAELGDGLLRGPVGHGDRLRGPVAAGNQGAIGRGGGRHLRGSGRPAPAAGRGRLAQTDASALVSDRPDVSPFF